MQTILVTGSQGQLGNEMQTIARQYPGYQFIFTDVDELDITNKESLEKFISGNKINYLINCAAYTSVDAAEEQVDLCYLINRDAVKNIGEVTAQHNIQVIHVSTDYVFNGKSYLPYTEDMPVSPTSIYGKSKRAGEEELLKANPTSIIIRTSWLYSSFGNNFVKTMLRLGNERDSLNVVFDQVGTPTYAADLATAIMSIIDGGKWESGIYHFSDEGVCSWYDFTKTIHKLAGIQCDVKPIETKDYPAKTPRPYYSVLNKAKIKSTYGINIPHWEESLIHCLKLLSGNKQ